MHENDHIRGQGSTAFRRLEDAGTAGTAGSANNHRCFPPRLGDIIFVKLLRDWPGRAEIIRDWLSLCFHLPPGKPKLLKQNVGDFDPKWRPFRQGAIRPSEVLGGITSKIPDPCGNQQTCLCCCPWLSKLEIQVSVIYGRSIHANPMRLPKRAAGRQLTLQITGVGSRSLSHSSIELTGARSPLRL